MVYNGKPYQNGMIWGYQYFRKHPYHVLTCMDQAGFVVILPMPNLIEAVIIIPATSTGLEPANIKKKATQHQHLFNSAPKNPGIINLSMNWNPLIQNVNHHPKKKTTTPPTFLFTKSPAWCSGNSFHLPGASGHLLCKDCIPDAVDVGCAKTAAPPPWDSGTEPATNGNGKPWQMSPVPLGFFGNPCNWYINPYQYYKLDDHLLLLQWVFRPQHISQSHPCWNVPLDLVRESSWPKCARRCTPNPPEFQWGWKTGLNWEDIMGNHAKTRKIMGKPWV